MQEEDRAFRQALEDVKTRIAQELHDMATARLHTIAMEGATIAEAVADIEDDLKREAVQDILLNVRVTALISSLRDLDILNHRQADELRAYLEDHLQRWQG